MYVHNLVQTPNKSIQVCETWGGPDEDASVCIVRCGVNELMNDWVDVRVC